MRAGVPGLLLDLEDDTANVLLTLARMWCTTCTREVVTKDNAANWALTRMPPEHRVALALARAVYRGEQDAAFDQLGGGPAEAAAFLAEAITRASVG